MVFALAHRPSGETVEFESLTEIEQAWASDGMSLWIDLEGPTQTEIQFLGRVFHLDPDTLEDCISGDQRPRIDEFDDYVFLVTYGMFGAENASEMIPRKLAAYCGPRFLLTAHTEPLRSIHAMRERCRRHGAQLMVRGVDFLLYSIMDSVIDKYALVVESYDERLDQLEEESLAATPDGAVLEQAAELRRNLVDLRRLAAAQRDLLIPLARGEYDYISNTLQTRFSHVRDHLTEVLESVEAQRELLKSIHDNYHTSLTNRLNQTTKLLSVFATILLPLTLVTGIYGMNLPLWPPPEHPLSFWFVIAAMVTLSAGMLLAFRWKRWL
ncbi:MAG: magnesium/cobalt transporter CorA [Planctomycetota bacterium]